MAIFKRGSKNEQNEAVVVPPSEQPIGPHSVLGADASVDEDRVKPGDDPVADEIAALEAEQQGDPQMQAAEAAEQYTLTPGARSLLDRAIDSLAKSDGAGIDDPEFKASVQNRAALLNATGGDLGIALSCIVDAMSDDPKGIASSVYNICYAVQKQALFFANLDYRRWLDPRADFDLSIYRHNGVGEDYEPAAVREALGHEFAADQREELREPPSGLDSLMDRECRYFAEVYGVGVETADDVFAASLSDLRTYLQLLTEAFGWSAETPMAYANVMEKDGTFTPITDPQVALDHQELQNKERRKVRQAKQASAMLAASKLAAAKLTAASARK